MKFVKKIDPHSLAFRLWLYMVIFALAVIAVIWLAQVYMLNSNYEKMRARQITGIASDTLKDYYRHEQLDLTDIANTAIENDIVVIIESGTGQTSLINQNGNISSFNWLIEQPMNSYTSERARIRMALREYSGTGSPYITMTSKSNSKYRTLSYGAYLDPSAHSELILYMFAPLYPVSSTISILKEMLIYVSVFAILLALFLALFISRRVSRPLADMRRTAERLSAGEYGMDFEGGKYTEVNELSNTLTYTSHELAKTDQLRKDIFANVSHDLKTPITMIRSYAEMVRDISGGDPEKRASHLDVIIDETERLNLLVNDMFTLSTMQSGVVEMHMEDMDLASAAKEIFASYEILESDGYDLHFSGPDTAMVRGDINRLKQVLSNLMNNAAKYSGDDKYISMDMTVNDGDVTLSVSDHGMGISDDDKEHIWDRYYRVSTNYHRSKQGTGLGLAIAKEILDLHHASYGVESEPGNGSRFWFSLPAAAPEKR